MLAHHNKFHGSLEEYPEKPDRIKHAYDHLRDLGYLDRFETINAELARTDDLSLVHTTQHIQDITETAAMSEEQLRKHTNQRYNDVYFSTETSYVARLSCGGAIATCEAIWERRVRNGLALIRPPGHHAETHQAMGFCIYNNVSVATKVMQKRHGVERIMILDWDIHHGNGTQQAFYDDPNVLYVSLHRYENGTFFPGMIIGNAAHIGGPGAEGRNVNIPWPCAGMGDADYIYAFRRLIMPIAHEFSPELVIISAGFDAAKDDPLGNCKVTPAGYAHMTYMLQSLACGRLAVCLEGGYNLKATTKSVGAVAGVLLGEIPPPLRVSSGPTAAAVDTINDVLARHSAYWKSLYPIHIQESKLDALAMIKREMSGVLALYRTALLTSTYNLKSYEVMDRDLKDRFVGQIHVSKNVTSHNGLVYIFVHPSWSDVRGCTKAFNVVDIGRSFINDETGSYIDQILRNRHAIIDVDVDEKSMNEHDVEHLTKEIVKYVWDEIGSKSVGRFILLGAGVGASGIATLVSTRSSLRRRAVCAVQYATTKPPAVAETAADWYASHSRVYMHAEHPLGQELSSPPNCGNWFSAGPEPKRPPLEALLASVRWHTWQYIAKSLGRLYLRTLQVEDGRETSPSVMSEESNFTADSAGNFRKHRSPMSKTVEIIINRPKRQKRREGPDMSVDWEHGTDARDITDGQNDYVLVSTSPLSRIKWSPNITSAGGLPSIEALNPVSSRPPATSSISAIGFAVDSSNYTQPSTANGRFQITEDDIISEVDNDDLEFVGSQESVGPIFNVNSFFHDSEDMELRKARDSFLSAHRGDNDIETFGAESALPKIEKAGNIGLEPISIQPKPMGANGNVPLSGSAQWFPYVEKNIVLAAVNDVESEDELTRGG
ncbi:hypothetical protein BC832DRAFT_46059 [Gaertneriomyces semiglobifer]|nr:hypothetical protein BC832DRAFT_46059 [Gaertneriomyces semiglobifer]